MKTLILASKVKHKRTLRHYTVTQYTSNGHLRINTFPNISSGARKKDVSLLHASFCRKLSFCQAHAFEVLTPTSTYRQFIIDVYFICQNVIPSKILSSNIIFCIFMSNANGIFKLWEFYHSHPFAGNKQSIYIVCFPAGCMHVFTSFCRAHRLVWSNFKQTKLLSLSKPQVWKLRFDLLYITWFFCFHH